MIVSIITKDNKYEINYPSETFVNDLRNNIRNAVEKKAFFEVRGIDNVTVGKEGKTLMINPNIIESIEYEDVTNPAPKTAGKDNAADVDVCNQSDVNIKQPLAETYRKAQEHADKLNEAFAKQGR